MDNVSLRYRFCGRLDVWMDGWIDSVSFLNRKEGWIDGWISVSLRHFYGKSDVWVNRLVSVSDNFCGKSDVWMEGWMYGRMIGLV